jgi:nuclease-like protein
MNTIVTELGYFLLMCLPLVAAIFLLVIRLRRDRAKTIAPFSELRRPAGESTRLRIQELDDRIDPWLVVLSTIPIMFGLVLTLNKPSGPLTAVCFSLSTLVAVMSYLFLRPIMRKRAAYQLGFHGERFVAEELNQLMADGFHVFHDVPFGKYNIDHVMVGPTGLFVVETKTKRKRVADGKENYKVLFDGTRLNFPNSWDTNALDQVRLNAKTLSHWLSSATADRITAHPILTIPAWFIERTTRSDVEVLNPKEIRSFVLSSNKNPLTPAEIQRASHQLEEKCKLPIG